MGELQPLLAFLSQYGYWLMAAIVLAEQLGMPLPAVPILVAMGALAGLNAHSLVPALMLAGLAAVAGDVVWYELGRRRGHAILNLLCRLSLEPDSCVSDTKRRWDRWGARTLLFAKFVPGLSTVAPPLAGLSAMSYPRFLLLDALGSLLWAAAYLAAGFLFRNQLEAALEAITNFGASLTFLVFAPLVAWLAWKYYNRHRFLKELRVARIAPGELHEMLASGKEVMVVDLRHRSEMQAEGTGLPTAIWMDLQRLEENPLPPDKEVVFYCS